MVVVVVVVVVVVALVFVLVLVAVVGADDRMTVCSGVDLTTPGQWLLPLVLRLQQQTQPTHWWPSWWSMPSACRLCCRPCTFAAAECGDVV